MQWSARVVTVAALAVAGCATHRPIPTTRLETGEVVATVGAPVVVRVTSRFAGPLAIYAMNAGVATRLGEVAGGRVEQFRLTPVQLPPNGLRLVAVPAAGDARAFTEPLRLAPGNVVEFEIGTALTDARAAVRSP